MGWSWAETTALPAPVFAELLEWLRDEAQKTPGEESIDMDRWGPPSAE